MKQGDMNIEVRRQQVELLYEALPRSLTAAVVVGIVLSYVQFDVIDPVRVAIWLSLHLLVTAVRLFLWRSYRRQAEPDLNRFDYLALVGAISSGLVWGSAGILLFAPQSPAHQFFLAFALGGMAAGSVAVLSFRREQAWTFITLALLPITIQWLVMGESLTVAEAVMTLAFAAVLYSMAAMTSHNAIKALTAEIEAESAATAAARDRDFLQLVLDTIPERVFWKDRHSRYLGCNELFARDAGCASVEEIIGKSDDELSWSERAEELRSTDRQVMTTGEAMLNFEDQAILKNNELRWREINKAPIRDAGGNIIGVLGTFHDITEKLEIEAQLRQAQKMEAVGTLVAGIAHEFNNMLTSITGNIFLARNQVETGKPKEAMENLDLAQSAGFSAAEMIRQLMTLSRKDQSLMQLVPTEMSQWLAESLRLAKSSVPANIRLQLQCDEAGLIVNADGTLLLQILVNLINNGCDAVTGSVAPEIRIALSSGRADEAFRRRHPDFTADEYVLLSVADNGKGIEPGRVERIFEPFYTTKDVGLGTGLGLAIVQGAMQSHHGTIDVKSRPGKGTTFKLYFPRLQDSADRQPQVRPPKQKLARGNGELILVADDEPSVLSMLDSMLSDLGYRVVTAADGKQAVELFGQHADAIRLVLLDIIMPNMTGPAAARRIRAIRPDVPLAFCTGYSQEEMQRELGDAGAFKLINKPFRAVDLSRMIDLLLRNA